MFKSIYSKFIAGYLLFGLIGFLAVALFSQKMTYNYLVDQNAKKLYNEATLIASTYEDEGYYFTDVHPDVAQDLRTVANFMNVQIWLIDANGKVILDSNNGHFNSVVINNFDPSADGGSYYQIGYYYRMFHSEMLSVMAPISHNYNIIGYLVMHYPMTQVVSSTNEILNIVYLTAAIIFVLSLIILLIFNVYVYVPMRLITVGAKEYAAGNLSYKIEMPNSHDEVSYLGDTLNYMAAELNNTEQFQHDFIANVSHDFRSPLTSIKGYLEAILDGTIPVEMQDKYLQRVISETERLSKLTEGMISLSSMEAKNHVQLTTFDINNTIREVCNANEVACRKKNITFDLEFEDQRELVFADEAKIKQVLYNLVDNAIKFSYNDSTITIRTAVRQRKVFVSVKDTGIGIPKHSIKKIWDRFYKTDLSRGKDKHGTGLGLSIVKEIIQAHNETIDVVSTEGAGTTFTFSLALAE